MKLLFADGQTLQVQAISAVDGKLHVSVLNNCYEQLKHLFTDAITTARIEVENDQGGSRRNIRKLHCLFIY